MRILVTGGAGFIGSNVADALIDAGHEVAIVDSLETGFLKNVNPKAKFYKSDIRDEGEMNRIFDEFLPEVVDHHAAQMDVRRSTRDPVYDAQCNILGSLNLIQAAKRTKVKRFLYVSTGGAVYGDLPESELPVSEDHTVNPVCQYGISKHTVEHYLFLYQKLYEMSYIVLRYPNVFGPRQTPHGEAGVVAIFAGLLLDWKPCAIFGDGKKTRDYVFIKDVVRANLLGIESNYNGILNIGSGIGTSDRAVYDAVEEATGMAGNIDYADKRPGEVEHIRLDSRKAKAILGWEPTVSFKDGVKQTVEYIRNNR